MFVNENLPCTPDRAQKYMDNIMTAYPVAESFEVTASLMGRPISGLKLGYGPKKLIVVGAHHALEWLTSLLLLRYCEEFCHALYSGSYLCSYDPAAISRAASVYIIPMLNPDGVALVTGAAQPADLCFLEAARMSGGFFEVSRLWQANARGVDLNHNYDALWEKGKLLEPFYGITGPGPTRFGGHSPHSEPEVRGLVDFVRQNDFNMAVALHSQGEVIYHRFGAITPKSSQGTAELLSAASGYMIDETEGIASMRGFKDWFILEFGRPGFTVEVGRGKNPLPLWQFDTIYPKLRELLLVASIL